MTMSRIRLASQAFGRFSGSRAIQHQLRPSWCYSSYAYGSKSSFTTTSFRRQEERQWSTPLAKQLFEAISVKTSPAGCQCLMLLTEVIDHRAHPLGELHAHVPDR